jgi:hypothetical protein
MTSRLQAMAAARVQFCVVSYRFAYGHQPFVEGFLVDVIAQRRDVAMRIEG